VDRTSCDQPHEVTKQQAIAEAGIPKRTAYDYEALAGGRDERAQAAGKAASENYYAQSRAKSEPPTMAELRAMMPPGLTFDPVRVVGSPPGCLGWWWI